MAIDYGVDALLSEVVDNVLHHLHRHPTTLLLSNSTGAVGGEIEERRLIH
jgi:hypothetical protein